ncbi:MAG: lipid-A-disaccharide synthase N-terminal domain-containing protein [Phycisphaerales bacterium]|nr:lipid-A-disaccharide synthase N-terminal domain-containing protein [Phycisphaerales bacterium]
MWVAIGFSGQLAFSFRMLIQWWVSEKRRESHVPMAFWLWSLVGSVMLFAYFIWRQDPVGVLGQCTGLVVYARNLRLIHKTRRRAARQGAADDGDDLDIDGDQNDDDAGDEPDHRATGDGFQARHDGSRRRPPAAAEVKLAPAGEPTSDLRN